MLSSRVPWILWPFAALWDLLAMVLITLGRLLTGLTGLLLMATGVLLTLTIVASPVGVPMAALGFLLLVRSLF